MSIKSKILDDTAINQKIKRLGWEIFEDNSKEDEIVIVGISGRGEFLASSLSQIIENISSIKITLGTISFDKDSPYQSKVHIDLNLEDYSNKVIILIDDVLNSGKTLMYASKYFLTTPLTKLSTAVLVERAHHRYPIKADYIGLSLATTLQEYIKVVLNGKEQSVYLL